MPDGADERTGTGEAATAGGSAPETSTPDYGSPLVFLVAGEPSGDLLGSRLMAALEQESGGRVRFAGVGGSAMTAAGLESLFPMADLSHMGLAEVLPHLPRLIRRLGETVTAIARLRPDIVVTIDSPEFSFRVARSVRRLGIPLVHYVAPQVWAWRPGRARRLARRVDHLLALLPFEPAFFERFGLACSFVGHSVLESGADRGDGAAFRRRRGLADSSPLVAVLPGSRGGEVRRLLPVFGPALARLAQQVPGLTAVVSTVESVAPAVSAALESWRVPYVLAVERDDKYDAFAACGAAITKSGTITLELALAGLPMVVCYRVSRPTALLARRLIRIPHVALVNLLLEEPVVPELLQDDCTPERIAEETARLLLDRGAHEAQCEGLRRAVAALGTREPPPSRRAARVVLEIVGRNRAVTESAV